MSIMYCDKCKALYGPTVFACPSCGSKDVVRVSAVGAVPSKLTEPQKNAPTTKKEDYK